MDAISSEIRNAYWDNLVWDIQLLIPPKNQNADYCFNVGNLAKSIWRNPKELAIEVQQILQKHTGIFKVVSSVGIYVNLCLTDQAFAMILNKEWIKNQVDENLGTVVVDYIGVNIGKPLHIWHLCTPSIGQVFCNIYRYRWMKVIGDVHTGDWWGIFWRLIAWWNRWWEEEKLEREPVDHLLELYQKISALIESEGVKKDELIDADCRMEFKKLSEWDPENMKLWSEFTSHSLRNMQKTIDLLHVKPDVAIGESFYEWLPLPKIGEYPDLQYTMKNIVQELIESEIAMKNEDGSVSISFPDDLKLPSNILQKQDGTHGYFASDLACIKYRVTNWWNPKKIIYCTDIRQQLHFQQVFTVAKMAGWVDTSIALIHAPNGFISLPEWAMSSRKGNIIRLDDLINESFVRTKKILEEKWRSLSNDDIKEIAIGALKYSYLMHDREKNIVFDWDKALNLEGNSGPYIQYAYVRAKKLRDQLCDVDQKDILSKTSFSFALTKYEKDLIKILWRFDSDIDFVLLNHKPHILAQYCYELAGIFNSFYSHTPSITQEQNSEQKKFRTLLVKDSVASLEIWFSILGIAMPSEM